MGVVLNPYISFRDNAREAMEFYRSVFGGDLITMTFVEGGMPHHPNEAHLLMHSQLTTPNGLVLMGADIPSHLEYVPGGAVSISLNGDDADTLEGYWQALSDGAEVQMPLVKAPWGDTFGVCVDRYGVHWLVNISESGDAE